MRRDHQYRIGDRPGANGERSSLRRRKGRRGQLLAVARVPRTGIEYSR